VGKIPRPGFALSLRGGRGRGVTDLWEATGHFNDPGQLQNKERMTPFTYAAPRGGPGLPCCILRLPPLRCPSSEGEGFEGAGMAPERTPPPGGGCAMAPLAPALGKKEMFEHLLGKRSIIVEWLYGPISLCLPPRLAPLGGITLPGGGTTRQTVL